MEKWIKWGLGLGISGVLIEAAVSASRLARFSKEFQLATNVRVQSVTVTNLILAIDITFKNPTDASLTLKHPTVYLYNRDPTGATLPTPVLTSTVQDNVYSIKPNSETKINPILMEFSFFTSTFLGTSYQILRAYLDGQPISLWVRALSQVNGTIPVVEVQSFTLNGKKTA